MKVYNTFLALKDRERVPRKIKKYFLGKKLSKNKLRKLLATVKIGTVTRDMYHASEIYPYRFCPKCGCRHSYGSGNKTEYPEHWEYFYCLRCLNIVAYIDNSPYVHALECKEWDYNPIP